MELAVKTNFGGILAGIEEQTGMKISTKAFSRSMPMSYVQARKLRDDQTTRYDSETLAKFVRFCARFGVKVTPNDIFKFDHIE